MTVHLDVHGISNTAGAAGHSQSKVLLQEAAVPQQPRPQLNANDAKDEEDEEAEEEDVAQHRQGVQEQVDQDTHTCGGKHGVSVCGEVECSVLKMTSLFHFHVLRNNSKTRRGRRR